MTERRMIVKGWKGNKVHGRFSDVHHFPTDRGIATERTRIGEQGLPDWQPHITEVVVEERTVTPWVEV